MTTASPTGNYAAGTTSTTVSDRSAPRRLSTETKASFKTSELVAYVLAVIGVLIASQVVGSDDGHSDYFRADRAWLYIVILTVGYLISRGLAKSGSRNPKAEGE